MTRFAQQVIEDVSHALREAHISHRAAGVAVGHSIAYAARRLNGEVPMSLDDLEALAAVAGFEVRVELVPASA